MPVSPVRTIVATLLALASLAQPARAQWVIPELPTSEAFHRSLREAAEPPPVERAEGAARGKPTYDKWFRASEMYAWGATGFDGVTTAKGISLGAQEVGVYRVVGARNTTGILITAGAVEVGLTLLSRKLYRDGHRKLATGVNFLRGSVHVGAGVNNLGVISQLQRQRK